MSENNKQIKKEREHLTYFLLSKYRAELFGISIILIMMFHFFHAVIQYTKPGGRKYFYSYIFCQVISSVGVEVFLLLSGMGLYFSYTRNKDVGSFFRKRFVRVLIPYAMYGSVAWFITDIVVAHKPFTRFLFDFSLFSFWIGGNTRLWFISAIVVFYAFFPLFYEVVTSKHYKLNTLLLLAFLVLAMYVSDAEKHNTFKIAEIAVTRLPIFIFGILAGRLAYEKQRVKPWHIAVIVISLIVRVLSSVIAIIGKFDTLPDDLKGINKLFGSIIGNRMESSLFSLGFIAVCIALLALIKWKPLHSFLKTAGGVSLELYMTHVTVNGIIRAEGTLDICEPPVYLLSMVISVCAAVLLHIASGAVINKLTRSAPAS